MSKTTAAHAGKPPFAPRGSRPGKLGVEKQTSSEVATLVYAVTVAVALGIACGAWINARLASAASITPPAQARSLPVAGANVQKNSETSAATEPRLKAHNDAASTADRVTPSSGFGEPPDAVVPGIRAAAETEKHGAGKRGDDGDVPAAGEASRTSGDAVRPAGTPEVERRAVAGQGRAAPCALYASAGSLTIRSGGAAALVVGGPGETGRVTVTTPHWSDIAVLAEGRARGNGWLRYTVRSVGNKPGVYTVRFTTSCGSQTIPVTVTRP